MLNGVKITRQWSPHHNYTKWAPHPRPNCSNKWQCGIHGDQQYFWLCVRTTICRAGTLYGSAKSCSCSQQIKMDLCVYQPWHNQGPSWNPKSSARCLSLRGAFSLAHVSAQSTFLSDSKVPWMCTWTAYQSQKLYLEHSYINISALCAVRLYTNEWLAKS